MWRDPCLHGIGRRAANNDPLLRARQTAETIAAALDIGLELDPKHVDIARARIAHVIGGTWEREVTPKAAPASNQSDGRP